VPLSCALLVPAANKSEQLANASLPSDVFIVILRVVVEVGGFVWFWLESVKCRKHVTA
jgi:hypothetical protein